MNIAPTACVGKLRLTMRSSMPTTIQHREKTHGIEVPGYQKRSPSRAERVLPPPGEGLGVRVVNPNGTLISAAWHFSAGTLRHVLLALIIVTVFLAAPISAAAKSASYGEFNVDLTVQDDGTYHVEETQVVDFVDGPFVQGHRSIPLARTEGVTNIAVYEIVDGKRVPYTKNSTPNANTFNVKTTSTEAEITWTFSTVYSDERTFVVVYDMLGALRTYPDTNPPAQEVWFTPVGSGLTGQTPVDSSTYTIHLPSAATASSVVLAVDGTQVTDLSGVTSDAQDFTFTHGAFSDGEDWEIRLQTDIVAPNAPSSVLAGIR